MTPGLKFVFLCCVCPPAIILAPFSLLSLSDFQMRATRPQPNTCVALWISSLLLRTAPPSLIAWPVLFILNQTFPLLMPRSLLTSSSVLSFLSFYLFIPLSSFSTTHFFPPVFLLLFTLVFLPPPLSVCSCAWCLAASESVLLQQLFQSKLTQTGSLVPAAQGCPGLRGPKAALFLQKMAPASLVTSSTTPHQPQRNLDLTKVQYTFTGWWVHSFKWASYAANLLHCSSKIHQMLFCLFYYIGMRVWGRNH